MNSPSLFVVTLFLLAFTCEAMPNPCHKNRGGQGKGVTCTKIVLPRGLCRACKLKPFQPNGDFKNCKAIYDLSKTSCRNQLKQYGRLNKACDPIRAKLVKNINKDANREALDFFVYAVCEECCDCVPHGAKLSEYKKRLATGTLYKANRGNCPAHAWFDFCKIWPKVKFVSLPGWKDPKFAPPICPLLKNWIKSPASKNWLQNNNVVISGTIKSFINRFISAAKCRNKKVWEDCQKLEAAQDRI